MNRIRSGKHTRQLSIATLKSLNSYALAATAAGVGMLALTPSAEAKIVYTPADVVIGGTGVTTYNLDVNGDGITDFVFEKTSSCDINGCFRFLGAIPEDGGVAFGGMVQGCLAMPPGAVIGPQRGFYSGFVGMALVFSSGKFRSYRDNWVNVFNHYLGLTFLIDGETHYGWARFSVTVKGTSIVGTLTGYAYETLPDTPIIAGKTAGYSSREPEAAVLASPDGAHASLGLLAQGAAGLQIWRREELGR